MIRVFDLEWAVKVFSRYKVYCLFFRDRIYKGSKGCLGTRTGIVRSQRMHGGLGL